MLSRVINVGIGSVPHAACADTRHGFMNSYSGGHDCFKAGCWCRYRYRPTWARADTRHGFLYSYSGGRDCFNAFTGYWCRYRYRPTCFMGWSGSQENVYAKCWSLATAKFSLQQTKDDFLENSKKREECFKMKINDNSVFRPICIFTDFHWSFTYEGTQNYIHSWFLSTRGSHRIQTRIQTR